MIVIGVDLSGPSNTADTAIVKFEGRGGKLECRSHQVGAGDPVLHALVSAACAKGATVVGLDAPLSYNPGGGDRPGDRSLRAGITRAGLRSGSVMPPTMMRMVYLTLRGVSVARLLSGIGPRAPRIVEVHPGASLALRGAPVADVRAFKQEVAARRRLLRWLERQGLGGAAGLDPSSDHLVAACGCALAAWKWATGEPAWVHAAEQPLHPFDFAC